MSTGTNVDSGSPNLFVTSRHVVGVAMMIPFLKVFVNPDVWSVCMWDRKKVDDHFPLKQSLANRVCYMKG